jgi:hypothetical protein
MDFVPKGSGAHPEFLIGCEGGRGGCELALRLCNAHLILKTMLHKSCHTCSCNITLFLWPSVVTSYVLHSNFSFSVLISNILSPCFSTNIRG